MTNDRHGNVQVLHITEDFTAAGMFVSLLGLTRTQPQIHCLPPTQIALLTAH